MTNSPDRSSADIVDRLREKRGVLDNRWPGPTALEIEAANEIEHLRLEHAHACQEIGVAVAERDEWKQAASVEAGLRREFAGRITGDAQQARADLSSDQIMEILRRTVQGELLALLTIGRRRDDGADVRIPSMSAEVLAREFSKAALASRPSPAAEPPRDLGLCDRVVCGACGCREALVKEVERLTRARPALAAVETEPSSWKLEVEALEADVARLQRSSAVKATAPWICCNCDAPLSCGVCGVEQPNDSAYYNGLIEENERLRALPQEVGMRETALEAAALDFIAKVDRGEARSKHSYAAFKAALALPRPQSGDGK